MVIYDCLWNIMSQKCGKNTQNKFTKCVLPMPCLFRYTTSQLQNVAEIEYMTRMHIFKYNNIFMKAIKYYNCLALLCLN